MKNRHVEVVSYKGGRGVERQLSWEAPSRSHSTQPLLSSLASGPCSSLVLLQESGPWIQVWLLLSLAPTNITLLLNCFGSVNPYFVLKIQESS